MKIFLTISVLLIAVYSFGQSVVGKSVADVAKDFDSYYVFKQKEAGLFRTVFVKGTDDKAEYLYAYSNKDGVIKIQLDKTLLFPDGNYYGMIDSTVVESQADFVNGYAIVAAGDELGLLYGEAKFGAIDSTGKLIVEPRFFQLGSFSEGLAAYSESIDDRIESGYINTKGEKEIILPESLSRLYMRCYFKGDNFENGIAKMQIVQNNHDCNCSSTIVINRQGKILKQDGAILDAGYKEIFLD